MNWRIITLSFGLVSSAAYAQADSLSQTVCLLGEVPVLVASANHVYRYHGGILEVGIGRLLVRVAPRTEALEFDHLVQAGTPMPLAKQQLLTLVVTLMRDGRQVHKRLPCLPGLVIADTLLEEGAVMQLGWTEGASAVVHPVLTARTISHVPSITGYKIKTYVDSTLRKQKVRKAVQHFTPPADYQPLSDSTIRLSSGGVLELRLQTFPLLTGDVIHYRLTETAESLSGGWQKSDYQLELPALLSGRTYRLELAYPGQPASSSYTIVVDERWYEKSVVRWLALLAGIILAVVVTRWFYRRRLRRELDTRNRVEEQLRTLQARLNPHFVFNALSSIEGLVSSGQNDLANHYLSMFSDIMRKTLKHSGELRISLSEDLSLLEQYLRVEQLRFDFQYAIEVDPSIEPATLEVPPMLVQPLVENAVKHGVASLGSQGVIRVNVFSQETDVCIAVEDNGKGDTGKSKTAGGHGLAFTRERLAQYGKLHPEQPIDFSMTPMAQGMTAMLRFRNLLS